MQTQLACARKCICSCRICKLFSNEVQRITLLSVQKAAANRVRVLAELDHTLKELIAADVCPKLLEMLKPEVDAGG